MKKKVLALLCAVTVFGSLLAGCGGASGESDAPAAPAEQGGSDETEAPEEAEEQKGGFKVAYIARNQSDPFAAELVNQFVTQAADYADTFTLDTFDAQTDNEKENSIIEDCITKQYDVIIISAIMGDSCAAS